MGNIAVLCSGGGTNLQALIDAGLSKNIVIVISNNPNAYALNRAKAAKIPTAVITDQSELLSILEKNAVDLVVLAGYMRVLTGEILKKYDHRIINIHPSLIPSFCGAGYYGLKVHEAALAAGVKVTGATVHYVSEVVDGGEIIAQKSVEVKADDTPESLQRRVMQEAEWVLLPKVVKNLLS